MGKYYWNKKDTVEDCRSISIEGENRPGIAAKLTEKLANAGINLRGFSAAVIGARFIIYIGFDNAHDAEKSVTILKQA